MVNDFSSFDPLHSSWIISSPVSWHKNVIFLTINGCLKDISANILACGSNEVISPFSSWDLAPALVSGYETFLSWAALTNTSSLLAHTSLFCSSLILQSLSFKQYAIFQAIRHLLLSKVKASSFHSDYSSFLCYSLLRILIKLEDLKVTQQIQDHSVWISISL